MVWLRTASASPAPAPALRTAPFGAFAVGVIPGRRRGRRVIGVSRRSGRVSDLCAAAAAVRIPAARLLAVPPCLVFRMPPPLPDDRDHREQDRHPVSRLCRAAASGRRAPVSELRPKPRFEVRGVYAAEGTGC